jgi:hypothetical protein
MRNPCEIFSPASLVTRPNLFKFVQSVALGDSVLDVGFCWISSLFLLHFLPFNDFPLHSPRSPVQRGDGPSFNGWWFGLGLNDVIKVMTWAFQKSVTAHFGVLMSFVRGNAVLTHLDTYACLIEELYFCLNT